MNTLILAGSFLLGLLVFYLLHRMKTGGFAKLASELLEKTQLEAEAAQAKLELSLKEKEFAHQKTLAEEGKKMEKKLAKEKERLEMREDRLDRGLSRVEQKLSELTKREEELAHARKTIENQLAELEKLSGMTQKEAEALLMERIETEFRAEAFQRAQRIKKEAEEEGEKEATRIIATAIGRLALPTCSEVAASVVPLPNDEMKGRIIGREGRNIRALELATGVNFVIDEGVVISGFDPVRKEIAFQTVRELIKDGRIHPTRIEEVVAQMEEKVAKEIKALGEAAALKAGVQGLHPSLLELLGKLNYRYSYGQNVLRHSIEVSHLMGLMTAELGLDVSLAKRIGLLHDVGKAVTHEIEGSHALLGHEFALKFGESEEVANGIGCHHEEMLPQTLEGSLCSAADKLSGGRPGARIEALEQYIKRARKLETLSCQFEGVERAYALQAGRELRVLVESEKIDDAATLQLARSLAKKIERELSYPGKIKITVIREKRATEYAS